MTTIKLKNGSGAPLAGDLVQGEPALDLTNKRLYTEDSGGTVIEVGTNPTSVTTGVITSTGIDVTGSVTATSVNTGAGIAGRNAFSSGDIRVAAPNDTNISLMTVSNTLATIKTDFYGGGSLVPLVIQTGTNNNQLYLDTIGNVGIGTSSPSTKLHLGGTAPGDSIIRQDSTASGTNWEIGEREAGKWQIFEDDGDSIVATFTSSGNVGIGVVPNATGGGYKALQLGLMTNWAFPTSGAAYRSHNLYYDGSNRKYVTTGTAHEYEQSSAGHIFSTALSGTAGTNVTLSEAMRIDASGNLLVGTTDTDPADNGTNSTADDGVAITAVGEVRSSRYLAAANSGAVGFFNRTGTDGDVVRIRKSGTTVGSLASHSGGFLKIVTAGNQAGLLFGTSAIYPVKNNVLTDNVVDLGDASIRYDDIFATNGTIQTSDRNEKQDIEALSDAEQRVAVAAKGLLRKFRWIDAVEAKGDDARIHFGIIAQDLQDAFTAEGLDAGRYAMFISTTWWESTEVIPAVAAQEAVVDEEGNVVEEAVEAQEERTVVHTHNTAEEAPEGSVERTRLGVRYSELLAFIIAAI